MIPLFILALLQPPAGLTPIRTLQLKADTHHVQGIDIEGGRLWLTSVDKGKRKGYLQEFSAESGELLRSVEVGEGVRFHPGGIAAAGDAIYVPVAEYKRNSTSVIQRRSKWTLAVEAEFSVPDHIGCVAFVNGSLVGANWDSRDFYVWDLKGNLLRKAPNPTSNGYQDLKFSGGQLVGGGVLPDHSGAIDWLEYPSLTLMRRIPAGRTDWGVLYTNEGMAILDKRLFLLPEDSQSRLFEFQLPF